MRTAVVRRLAALSALPLAALLKPLPAQDLPAGPVVTTSWVASQLQSPSLVLLHVGERAGYDQEHIPGARFVEMRDVSHRTANGLPLELLPPDSLRRQLEALGISDRSRVVVYFGKDWVTPATRILFTLDWAGLGDRSALLDGGLPAWKAAGHPVTSEATAPRSGRLSPLRVRGTAVVDGDFVRANLGRPGLAIVDARAAMFYDGPKHGEHRAGHVPGARNIPFSEIADDQLRIKDRAALESLFRQAGVKAGDTIVAYCHIGQQATAVVLAARLLGHDVKLYDGSFDDWSRRESFPVETGTAARR
jgi:thiosulfate/3-mercaptopyruvate sulfurtransferase